MAKLSTVASQIELRLDGRRITIPRHFRDDTWSSHIGLLQRDLDLLSPGGLPLQFDFGECRWIDPLPALSLLIEMTKLVKRGVSVKALFPALDKTDTPVETKEPYHSSPNKLLLFLAKEGFFTSLLEHDIHATIGISPLTKSVLVDCTLLKTIPSYADASLISIHLYDTPKLGNGNTDGPPRNGEFAAETVSELLNGVESSLRSRCSAPERRHLLYTLRAVLQEFLHNVQEHAYPTEDFRPAGIYVRYRKGLVGLSSPSEKEFYLSCAKEEISRCKKIGFEWLNARRGCLEIFFLDRGLGMSKKFLGQLGGHIQFRKAMESTFFRGNSSKTVRTTEHGGLHLLHTLMSRRNDYLRAVEDNSWFGTGIPFPRKQAQVTNLIQGLRTEQGLIGLAYHVRLSWKASTDDGDKWLRFGSKEIEILFRDDLCEVAGTIRNPLVSQGRVVDERFESFGTNSESTTTGAYLLWLPSRNLMKWDVLNRLEQLAVSIESECTLVVADIPNMEAATYEAAISKSDFDPRETWPRKFKAIILATNRLSFAYAEHRSNANGFHGFSTLSTKEIPQRFKPGIGRTGSRRSFRQLVVGWLKWHDSECFWREAKKSGRLFLAEKVVWDEDEKHVPTLEIDGYLDFPSATHNRYCAALFRNSLSRILGTLGEKVVDLVPVDSLAAPVVHDVYANEVYDPPTHGQENVTKIAVGSVLVSGSTLHATGLSAKSIHFFVHGKSPYAGKFPSLFYWFPKLDHESATWSQRRIGKTSAIAPEGWLSIEVPRRHSKVDLEGGRLPAETYEDWQNPGPIVVKAGHWCYEGHHDFLTVNIPDAVDDAFLRNGPLAQFLVRHVLHHLGVVRQQMCGTYSDYPASANTNSGLLVYRSHPSSERIVDRILGVLKDDVRLEISKSIFPVLPLRMRWGGSTLLIPPRMRDEIASAINEKNSVMIFDDAAISGRTIQDLLTSLRAMGAKSISVLTIVNRLRLPAETAAVKYFWRLDMPTIGREGNCPLCQALDTARSFGERMVHSSEANKDLLRWISAWESASPLSRWDAGLDPLPLAARQSKHYCYQPSSRKYLAEIPIYRSTGLMIHSAELHAMTASDNYGLKNIRKLNDPAIKIGLAVSQLLLFGDEFDHDVVRDLVVEGLLLPMAKLPNDSPYGPLAVLVMMKTLSTVPVAIQQELATKAKAMIEQFSSLRHGQILIAYFVSQRLLDWSDDTCYSGIRLLSTRHRHVADKLRALFRETVSASGDIHSEPIPRLKETLDSSEPVPSESAVWSALASIASLRDIMNELGADMATRDGGKSYVDRRNELFAALDKAELPLKQFLDRNEFDVSSARDLLNEVMQCLNSIADCYFYRIPPDEVPKGHSFESRLSVIWTSHIDWKAVCESKGIRDPISSADIRLSTDSGSNSDFGNARWVWIPWTKSIQAIVRDLLMNSVYRHHPVADPWAPGVNTAATWIHVRFEQQSVCISIANSCSQNREKIFGEVMEKSKGKTRWDQTEELGGSIHLGDIRQVGSDDILVITLRLPYAPFLTYSK